MTADDTTPARVAAAAEEHLFISDLRKHPHAEVRLHVGGRPVSGTWPRQVTASIDAMIDAAVRAALDAQPGDAEQAGGLPWGDSPYDKKTPAEVVHDYAVVRGDLSEQYARDQLATWIERYAAIGHDRHRDLVSRLGFGDNITEPMADNFTIAKWFEERGREADEWREHERWRDDCHIAGHPNDEDCEEHGPSCCVRTHLGGPDDGTAERALDAEALLAEFEAMAVRQSRVHNVDTAVGIRWAADRLRAAADAGHQGGES